MKKMKFVVLGLFVMLAGGAGLQADIAYSPPTPRTGETVTFTLSPSGAPTGAISWNFGDGSPVQSGPGLTVTHVYAAVGSYTAKASYATMSHFQVDQATVAVNDPRQVIFSPPQPKAGQAVAFTALDFYSSCIRWDFGDGTIKNGVANESHTYANAGSYIVRAFEECGSTYGAAATLAVAPPDQEEPTPPVTPTAPSLAVAFINLYFAGGKADVNVTKDSAGLQALADIQVTGTGILQWQWLVDGMVVKADTMSVSFSNKFSLDSGKVPGLPTSVPGRHQVTLRFQNPKTDFTIPAITYFVALKGPAPVILRVKPSTLAPGKEYTLELEGSDLTPGTEILFPAPLAMVKKANILSPTRAQVIVFVAPTAAAGTKLATAKNEYGESSGPGQVTIAASEPTLPPKAPDVKPYPGPNPPIPISITFTSPTGGETWELGTTHAINYNLAILAPQYQLCLLRNGSFVGYIMFYNNFQGTGYPPGDYTYAWQVGKVMMEDEVPFWAPIGSGYTICAGCCGSGAPPYGLSNEFTISLDISLHFTRYNKIFYGPLPDPGDCPECLILDLPGLHEEMVNFIYTLKAELYWKGKPMAELGKFGKGQGFAAKLQIKLGPEALAAVKRGEEFELRLFDDAGKQFHSQKTQLVPLPGSEPALPPQPGPKPDVLGPVSSEWLKKALSKMPVLEGSIDLFPYAASPYVSAMLNLSREGKPLSGAVITIDGLVVPETPMAGHYRLDPPMNVAPGHVFNVSLTIDGVTYKGSGGKVDTLVKLSQPPWGSTIYFKKFPQFDCQWTFSNGPAPVRLYLLYIGEPNNKGFFDADVNGDHCTVPTAGIPGDQGFLYAFLSRKYNDIVFDELPAWAAKIAVFQNFGQPQSRFELSASTLEKAPLLKKTGDTPAQAAAAQPAKSAIVTELNKTPTLNGHITYDINTDPDSSMAARSTFNFSKADGPIPDAVIKVDGKVIPPNLNNLFPDYGCQGCYKYEGPWPGIAVGHVTTISITTGGTTYTGSGGPIDSFPQLVKPADGATISLQQTPYLNLQWTGAGGIVPVLVNVTFRGGGKHVELYHSQVYTDHVQVHLVKPYDSIPEGASGLITVSLTKECNRMVMDGMMRFTSSPHVVVHKNFYLQLVP